MSDLFGIEGAHVLVTGGSSGLGRFFATFLAATGSAGDCCRAPRGSLGQNGR